MGDEVLSLSRGTSSGRRSRTIGAAILLLAVALTTTHMGRASASSAVTPGTFTTPIKHVVVIYQENHSFDEVLGNWCNTTSPARCDGFTGTVTLKDGSVVTMQQSPDVVPNVSHEVGPQKSAIDGGRMDGWELLRGCAAGNNYACLSYYTPAQVPNLTSLASKFAVSDRTFSMEASPSWGGHLYAVAATQDGFTGAIPQKSSTITPGPGWGCDSNKDSKWLDPSSGQIVKEPSCIPDPSLTGVANGGAYRATPVPYVPTIMDRLDAAGLTWYLYTATAAQPKNYVWAVCPSFAECLDTPQHLQMVPTASVLTDAQDGTLPNFSLVLPGSGAAAGASQHNGSSMLTGDNWIGKVVSTIENGPDWSSTAIFITYDDCGCFYDHVAPPTNPDGTKQGPRVPMVIVSPYARAGFTDSTPATFASILAYEESVFSLSPLSTNDAAAYNFSNSFDYTQTPLTGPAMVQTAIPAGEKTQDESADPT